MIVQSPLLLVFISLGASFAVTPPRQDAFHNRDLVSANTHKQSDGQVCTKLSGFKGTVSCNNNELRVFVGHCLGYIDSNRSNLQRFVLSRCPYYAGTKTKKLFTKINITDLSATTIIDSFCSDISDNRRQYPLCGRCKSQFAVAVLSPNFECKDCNKHNSTIENYLKLFGATVLPLTVLFFIIVIFHIGLTSAPTNAYIFFSHVITTKLNVLIIESAWTIQTDSDISERLSKLLLYPLYIWNLDFAYYFKTDGACIGRNPKIMYIIVMEYIYALYPMALLLLTLILVKLHGRNCKPVVFLWKPFCYLCVRLRRNWNVRTSLIDAFATCILLSYSKLIDTSLALINPNPVYDQNGTTVYNTLHYDTSTKFLSTEHLPYFIIAIMVLSTFGLLPPMLLILYPFRWFQKLLNAFRLNRVQSLHIFLDAFQGCYKNGTGGTPERRYFAGFYFIFRIIVIFTTSFGYATLTTTIAILTIVYAIFLCVIAIFQPYKKKFYNILDASFFLILIINSSNSMYSISYALTRKQLPPVIWPFTYTLLLIPSTYMVLYILYWILTRFRARYCQRCLLRRLRGSRFFIENEGRHDSVTEHFESTLHTSLESVCNSFPDRINNPYRYRPQSPGIFRQKSDSISERKQNGGNAYTHYGAITY